MTGILLSIVVVSTSAFISAQKIVKRVRQRQPVQSSGHDSAKEVQPIPVIPDETTRPQPYVPAKDATLTQILAIYQQIALQKGYYAGVIDILNHSEGINFILWLEAHDISSWQESFDLQPISDLTDPAASLTLYEQDLHSGITDLPHTDFTRITLFTMHYTTTNLVIKSTKPNTNHAESKLPKQLQTKDLTRIHHKPGVELLEMNHENQKPRIIPLPQAQNNFDLFAQETKDAT
ncbi:MAG: hypothetical protein KatS3mg087_1991 [Patescibacteria group bacterium]|nr:MAG: hypothetical protein KatS3mg087_1991 [Patescibacteria group bacterium]